MVYIRETCKCCSTGEAVATGGMPQMRLERDTRASDVANEFYNKFSERCIVVYSSRHDTQAIMPVRVSAGRAGSLPKPWRCTLHTHGLVCR